MITSNFLDWGSYDNESYVIGVAAVTQNALYHGIIFNGPIAIVTIQEPVKNMFLVRSTQVECGQEAQINSLDVKADLIPSQGGNEAAGVGGGRFHGWGCVNLWDVPKRIFGFPCLQ
jgi:glycerol dehydrogenase-like iron-containing ADH family enzyme